MGLSQAALDTSEFYDRWTSLFVGGFGSVLQAGLLTDGVSSREDPEQTVLELAARAGIRDGDRVLDAGCGVAGPATIISAHFPQVIVDGVTVSHQQVVMARDRVASEGLADRVRVHLGDYQRLPLRSGRYDVVLFFESTGYATDLSAAYREAHRVLRDDGRLYVKDVFQRPGPLTPDEQTEMDDFDELWGCVRTKTLAETVEAIEAAGFEVDLWREMPEVGTTRFTGSMFTFEEALGLRPTELGAAFVRRALNPPIVFSEVRAVKPS